MPKVMTPPSLPPIHSSLYVCAHVCGVCVYACMRVRLYSTRFNKIAIQARAHVAADKEAVGLSSHVRI